MNAEEYQNRHKIRYDSRHEPRGRYREGYDREIETNYVGYDYMDLVADGAEVSFLLDSYGVFGWELDEYASHYREHAHRHVPNTSGKVTLPLKRDRKIANKTELTRLQRNFEACVRELETLEKRKTSKAIILALIIGFIGTVFMTGAVFAVVAKPPHILLCILLAIPAIIGWAVPYPLYRRIVAEESARLDTLIAQKYDEIHAICERGSKLSYGNKEA